MFWKIESSRNYLTPFGVIDVERKVTQSHEGRDSLIPLDEKLCMVGEFATCEIRESILWSAAYLTPRETATMLKKCALFHPSPTAIQNIVNDSGDWLEENRDNILITIRAEDKIPKDNKSDACKPGWCQCFTERTWTETRSSSGTTSSQS